MAKEGNLYLDLYRSFKREFETLKEVFKCAVCLCDYDRPTALIPCGHIFCETCVDKFHEYSCPHC